MDKARRRLELEKEELQAALEEAESALEIEESKVQQAQLEVSAIRADIDRRIAEKEEEFENTRYALLSLFNFRALVGVLWLNRCISRRKMAQKCSRSRIRNKKDT